MGEGPRERVGLDYAAAPRHKRVRWRVWVIVAVVGACLVGYVGYNLLLILND